MQARLSLLLIILIILSACAPSAGEAPPPNLPVVTSIGAAALPGMPDRPGSAQEAVQPYYREDTLDAIGATGNPQLLVFWAPSYDTGGCLECEIIRAPLQELEAEFWDQVDFVYLNHEHADVNDLRTTYGIPNLGYRMSIVLLSPTGDMVRRFYDVTRNQGIGFALDDNIIRSALDKYLSEQEDQA